MDEEIRIILAEEYDRAVIATDIEKWYFDSWNSNDFYNIRLYETYIYILYVRHTIKINEYYSMNWVREDLVGYKKCPKYVIPIRISDVNIDDF